MGKPLKSILQPERFLATIAYDGTDFHGWQVNPNQRTVESTIEERLSRIFRTPIDVHGSGRTDAGVHSVGQRFHFDAFWPHPAKHLVLAINSCEQEGLLVTDLRRVPADFHCRHWAKGKRYRYEICQGWPPPWEARYCYGTGKRVLDPRRMRAAAKLLLGTHDFRAFSGTHAQGMEHENPVKDLRRLDIAVRGERITITTEASGYLYKMVRRLVGGLMRVGEGKLPPERLAAYRDEGMITAEIPTAPARGLFMEKVFYDPADLKVRRRPTGASDEPAKRPARPGPPRPAGGKGD